MLSAEVGWYWCILSLTPKCTSCVWMGCWRALAKNFNIWRRGMRTDSRYVIQTALSLLLLTLCLFFVFFSSKRVQIAMGSVHMAKVSKEQTSKVEATFAEVREWVLSLVRVLVDPERQLYGCHSNKNSSSNLTSQSLLHSPSSHSAHSICTCDCVLRCALRYAELTLRKRWEESVCVGGSGGGSKAEKTEINCSADLYILKSCNQFSSTDVPPPPIPMFLKLSAMKSSHNTQL